MARRGPSSHGSMSNSPEALSRVDARRAGGMDAVRAEQAGETAVSEESDREHRARALRAGSDRPGPEGQEGD